MPFKILDSHRLADLDIDVGDIGFYKKLPAPGGHDGAVIARERCGHHADPENNGGGRLSGVPDADDVDASPLHLHRFQKGVELESQVAFPGLHERVVTDGAELLELLVRLWAGGCLPRSSASASDQDWGRGQAGVVELGLHL